MPAATAIASRSGMQVFAAPALERKTPAVHILAGCQRGPYNIFTLQCAGVGSAQLERKMATVSILADGGSRPSSLSAERQQALSWQRLP